MKCLYIGFMLFAQNYVTWSQEISYSTNEETSHVSDGYSTIRTNPTSLPNCPKDMILYPGKYAEKRWLCDCRPRFLYFALNNSCFEAYTQGPCPPKNYIVLPENEAVPRCVENPCEEDGVVEYNGTCHPLKTIGGPCGPDGVIAVNKDTLQLECVGAKFLLNLLSTPVPGTFSYTCSPGSQRSILGTCRRIVGVTTS